MQAHCDKRLHLDDWCNLPERRSPGSLGHSLWLIKAKLIFFANSDSSMTSFIQIKVHRLLKLFIPLLWDYQIWNVCYKNTCTSPNYHRSNKFIFSHSKVYIMIALLVWTDKDLKASYLEALFLIAPYSLNLLMYWKDKPQLQQHPGFWLFALCWVYIHHLTETPLHYKITI